ncbi:hypothetical protein BB561_006170 [Smittium simulii]|uniref:SAM domain-containing protein n=1 Tax=Smittium simulii TaxID=133385 RepID=A0A2T9Y644_9FUNG|nr:hypothetical protein BB561_006170 [Smittium simulii]
MNEYSQAKGAPYRRVSEGNRLNIISSNPVEWNVEEVCNWFASQPRLADLAPFIKMHCLDGHILLNYVSNTVLRDELGITAFGQRVRLLEALEALKWKSSIDRHGK